MSAVVMTAAIVMSPAARGFDFSEGNDDREWRTLQDAWTLDAPGTVPMLRTYAEQNPTGIHALEARLMVADAAFFAHDWSEALRLYRAEDIKGLSQPERSLYSYRKALCLLKTGYYKEARTALRSVKGKKYDAVRTFYDAYIDYIEGDYDKAYQGFAQVPEGEKGLEAAYYMLQIDYMRGEYRKVAEKAQKLVSRDVEPGLKAEIYRIAGLSRFKLEEDETGRRELEKYLELNHGPVNNDALYALGVIDYEEGNYASAAERLTAVTESAERGPLLQSAWLYLGQTRLSQDYVRGATLAFEKASAYEADPEVAQTAMYNYITAQTRGTGVPFGKSAELIETYMRRWPASPHAEEMREYLATAYYNDHNYLKAISTVDGTRTPTPVMLDVKQKALYAQGVSMATNGDVAGSAPYFEKASEMKTSDPDLALQSLLWLGDARYEAGQFAAAERSYSRYVQGAPASANRTLGLYDLAYAQYRLERYGQAAATFSKALESRPALNKAMRDDALIRRADCLYYTGDYTGARQLYTDAISDKANDSDYAAYRYAMLSGKSEGQRKKITLIDQFVRDYPRSKWLSAALLEKALTCEELGETAMAAEAYRKRLAITPDADVDELLRAAAANDRTGDAPTEQLELLKRIRKAGSLGADDTADIDYYEANALSKLGRDDEADALYESLSRNPESPVGAASAVTLAQRRLDAGNAQEAFDMMNAFTDTGTPHTYWLAKGFIVLADACRELGRPELAREYLTSLRDNYPGNEADILSAINSRLKSLKK